MDINANLEDLLASLRAEKQAEAGDGVDQRNVEGTSHPSGQTEVTKDDNLMHEETGPRYSENEGDVASSYSNTPEETEQASQTEEGNLSQEPMAVTTEEKPQEDGNPKKEKDDSPTEHPAATDKAASASEKIAKALDALDALIKKAEEGDKKEEKEEEKKAEEDEKKEDEGAEESKENPKPEPAAVPAPEKAENDYSEGDVKEAAEKNPEAAQLGYILAANKHQEEQIKQAYEADPEGFMKGLEEGEKFAEAFQAGEKKAQAELEKVAEARLGEVITRAETSAQCVGEYLTGFAHAQMKKAGIPVPPEALAAEEEVAPEVAPEAAAAEGAAEGDLAEAVEAIEGGSEGAAPEAALAGEEAAAAPVDAAAVSEAIDQALSDAEATGPASEEEIAEALAEVLTSSDVSLGDELAAEIGEEEKMAKEKAASSKLTPAIKKAAIKKIVLKRLAEKRAKSKK